MGDLLKRTLAGELGSKTVTAAGALLILVALNHFNYITPDQFDQYTKLAEALGIFGLRDALSKLPKES